MFLSVCVRVCVHTHARVHTAAHGGQRLMCHAFIILDRLSHQIWRLPMQPVSSQWAPEIYLHLIQGYGGRCALPHSPPLWQWDSNPGPHGYAATTLSAEASYQSSVLLLTEFQTTQIAIQK